VSLPERSHSSFFCLVVSDEEKKVLLQLWDLVGEEREVVAQLVVGRDDGAVAGGIELRPSGSAENLEKMEF